MGLPPPSQGWPRGTGPIPAGAGTKALDRSSSSRNVFLGPGGSKGFRIRGLGSFYRFLAGSGSGAVARGHAAKSGRVRFGGRGLLPGDSSSRSFEARWREPERPEEPTFLRAEMPGFSGLSEVEKQGQKVCKNPDFMGFLRGLHEALSKCIELVKLRIFANLTIIESELNLMVQTDKKRPVFQSPSPVFEGIRRVLYGDPHFPSHLTSLPHVPISLWYKGELQKSDSVAVAVVGSRSASSQGLKRAYRLSAELAQAGVTVVSGLAQGIDGAAHRGALAVGGRTLAVLGTGLNRVYPEKHRDLSERIVRSGAVFSQFDPEFTGYRSGRNFLQRNQVLTGLSQVLVVIEAKERSGSASAVRAALSQGKPVGLLRSLVESQKWAFELAESGQAFVIDCTEDVLGRVAF
jgi:DNA protecting protein DprA